MCKPLVFAFQNEIGYAISDHVDQVAVLEEAEGGCDSRA